jgi:hypothetical protein
MKHFTVVVNGKLAVNICHHSRDPFFRVQHNLELDLMKHFTVVVHGKPVIVYMPP